MTAPRRQNISPLCVDIIQRIYDKHAAGCCWHVVLDDENWDSIEWTKQWVADTADECQTGGACAELAALDVTASILRRARKKALGRS